MALSASDLAWIRGIVRQELDRNDTRLHHIAMALQVARGERENYLGRDIQEIRRNQVAAAQKAVDNVLKFYAASEDSALHKIIRDSNPD